MALADDTIHGECALVPVGALVCERASQLNHISCQRHAPMSLLMFTFFYCVFVFKNSLADIPLSHVCNCSPLCIQRQPGNIQAVLAPLRQGHWPRLDWAAEERIWCVYPPFLAF